MTTEIKLSDMTPGAALGGTELLEMTQGGDTYSTTPNAIKTWTLTAPLTFTGAAGSSLLTLTGATQTTSFPVITATQTWNAGGVTFTGWKLNITSTASAAGSLLMDLQLAGVTQFNVTKGGLITATGGLAIVGPITGATTGAFSGAVTVATIKTAGTVVGSLGTPTAGLRNHVTDSNAALTAGIGAIVAAGGGNIVPVFADGTNWRIG